MAAVCGNPPATYAALLYVLRLAGWAARLCQPRPRSPSPSAPSCASPRPRPPHPQHRRPPSSSWTCSSAPSSTPRASPRASRASAAAFPPPSSGPRPPSAPPSAGAPPPSRSRSCCGGWPSPRGGPWGTSSACTRSTPTASAPTASSRTWPPPSALSPSPRRGPQWCGDEARRQGGGLQASAGAPRCPRSRGSCGRDWQGTRGGGRGGCGGGGAGGDPVPVRTGRAGGAAPPRGPLRAPVPRRLPRRPPGRGVAVRQVCWPPRRHSRDSVVPNPASGPPWACPSLDGPLRHRRSPGLWPFLSHSTNFRSSPRGFSSPCDCHGLCRLSLRFDSSSVLYTVCPILCPCQPQAA
eukprot:TRINITY_DN12496_c1_g1_i1.p1 TRINITY_DN12496_c1_g1~~TRINITY_DN12496_c1_g1_i1.p1  ORF type:complete len:394 (-),score=-44.81 TRINITY_DN12496_c1_g1_i1:177-1229(-)